MLLPHAPPNQPSLAPISAALPEQPNGNLTIKQAMRLDAERTRHALTAEIQQMLDLKVLGRREKVITQRVLPSKMFLKYKESGTLKTRLVLVGTYRTRKSWEKPTRRL